MLEDVVGTLRVVHIKTCPLERPENFLRLESR